MSVDLVRSGLLLTINGSAVIPLWCDVLFGRNLTLLLKLLKSAERRELKKASPKAALLMHGKGRSYRLKATESTIPQWRKWTEGTWL